MPKKYFLGIDNGTTGTTALLLDENWNQVSRGYREISTTYPHDGWVEQDALEIWESILDVTVQACRMAGIAPQEIASVGFDNVGETVVLWDKETGKPVYNAIVWQDRRTAAYCDSLKENYDQYVKDRAGVMLDSYFSATKIKWIMDHVDGVREKAKQGRIIASTLDGWTFWNMTAGRLFVTDAATASRTMLMNIHTGKWDSDLLSLFDIPEHMLPIICDSSCYHGMTDPGAFLGAAIPIGGGTVDQQSSLFGQACFTSGMTKCTYGTGCFMLMNTGEQMVSSVHGILSTVAWQLNHKMSYAMDGGVYVAGAATQWLRDKLGIIKSASETEAMAISAGTNGGVYFVPAFSGLAAPHWDSYARGTMVGITGGTTKEHIVRATLEATCYQVKDNLDVMREDSGVTVPRLRVDGGAVVNRFLMQFQADILNIPIDVPVITETTALGAAYMAAMANGEFSSLDDISNRWKLSVSYIPNMSEDQRQYLMSKWHKAVQRARDWADQE